MPYRTCGTCGGSFWQGLGRPAKRCPTCRGETTPQRYGSAHQKLRAATVDQAAGGLCVRCHEPIRAGDAVDLDHADDGNGCLGYSHRSCNARAGAVNGNRARAAAYRAAKAGLAAGVPPVTVEPPPSPTSRVW